MKLLTLFLLTGIALALNATLPQGRPRIFATEAERPTLQKKIREVKWARDVYDRLKREVTPYVERHKQDPQWIISRLQMNWEPGKYYTRFWAGGNKIDRREGNAEYPTVMVAAGRVGKGSRPKLEQVKPYSDGDTLLWRDGKQVMVPFADTGLAIEDLNRDVLNLAYKAAIVYYFTGDKDFAKFAADVIWVFVRGAAQQEQLNPGSDKDSRGKVLSYGYLSYETLGDGRRFFTIPLTYDFIFDYLDKEYFVSAEFRTGRKGEERWAPGHRQGHKWAMDQFQIMFQKMVENKINRGGGLIGNWNLNEQFCALPYAFAMDDDSERPDRKGRQYYIDYLLKKTTPGNGAYFDVLKANIAPHTGLWPEAPAGYGQGSIQQLVLLGYWYHKQGIELLDTNPLLKKAASSFPQIAFPNGRATAWGDGAYSTVYTLPAELMIAYSREKGDTKLEKQFTALINFAGKRDLRGEHYMPLFFYVPELAKDAGSVHYPRVSYSQAHALLFGRNRSEDKKNALAYTVYGFAEGSGHYHEHGLAMELYGRGEILGCDFGAGLDYWHRQHRMFNRMAVAHNTVVVNGAEIGSKSYMPLAINYANPMPVPGKDPETETSPDFQFSDVSTQLRLRQLTADMRRVNGIVRIGDGGFYVDIFRVKMLKGKSQTFDYLYHNMGNDLKYGKMSGGDLSGKAAEFNQKSGFGYEYLTEAKGIETPDGVKGEIPYGKKGISMNFFIPGNEHKRIFYSMKSPVNFRYYDRFLKKIPVPTFMLRRTDNDTWDTPFIVVYEPAGDGVESQVVSVKKMPSTDELVVIEIKLKNGHTVTILNSDNPHKLYRVGNIEFQGIYGVITSDKLYLGYGKLLKVDAKEIKDTVPVSKVISR